MEGESSNGTITPPIFDGVNYKVWAVRMEIHLKAYDLWEAVEQDYEVPALGDNPTMVQIKTHKEKVTRKAKAMNCLFSAVSPSILSRIMQKKSAAEIWKYLEKEYKGNAKLDNMQVMNLFREFETQRMKESETAKEYADRLLDIANKGSRKACGGSRGSKWVGAFSMLPALSEVQLSDCNIQNSTLFLSFANFSSLVVMNLRFNHLNPFPIWLVNISSLLYVDLSFNSMQGSIPLGFCKLPNLRLLNLKNNNLSVSSYQLFTQSWSKVKFLQLYNNSVHGKLPASIGSMTYLTHLDLSSNYIESGIPSSISKLCYLEYLDLSHNNLNGKLPEDLEGTNNCLGRSPLPHLQKLLLRQQSVVWYVAKLVGSASKSC
ncbi:hypothetical protein GH714_040512 [Hevea brasiliensis]|uniref:Uncharacterized protein n=1 Tax=Hevea brasiliensis TaxID=3981 RepID=A0A6A6L557_HEVBR|nr:hypothetical protein GH714_040512 [Hevea brasiliensis]